MIVLEDGIPIPEPRERYKTMLKATMGRMKVGQSFLIPTDTSVTNIWPAAKALKIKITTQKQPDGMTRVWRIK